MVAHDQSGSLPVWRRTAQDQRRPPVRLKSCTPFRNSCEVVWRWIEDVHGLRRAVLARRVDQNNMSAEEYSEAGNQTGANPSEGVSVFRSLVFMGLSVVVSGLAAGLLLGCFSLIRGHQVELWRIAPGWLLLAATAWFLLGTVLLTSIILTIKAGGALCEIFFAIRSFGFSLKGDDARISPRHAWGELSLAYIYVKSFLLFLASVAVSAIIESFWLKPPFPIVLATALLLTSVLLLVDRMRNRNLRRLSPFSRQMVVAFVMPVVVLLSVPVLAIGAGFFWSLLTIQLLLLLFRGLTSFLCFIAMEPTIRATCRGDYDEALKRLRYTGVTILNRPAGEVLRNNILLLAGRLEEAKLGASRSLARAKGRVCRAAAMEDLGAVLLEQAQYAEANELLKQALPISKNHASVCNALAEVCLHQEAVADKALRFLDSGIAKFRELPRWRGGETLGCLYANKAWALFRLRRDQEAAEALAQARKATANCVWKRYGFWASTPYRPGIARIHYCLGRALVSAARDAEAAAEFRSAIELDPSGHSGKLAADLFQRAERPLMH